MRPNGPTSWFLDGLTGWLTAASDGVSVGSGAPIRLAGDPGGPLALNAPDGSLGGITLPSSMALDEDGILYLLSAQEPRIKRFDPPSRSFVLLPAVGGAGTQPRQFGDPAAIAIAGHNLYVVERGNQRVQVFALGSLALRSVWRPWDSAGNPVPAGDPDAWNPIDVTSQAGAAYILDQRHGRVYRHVPGSDDPRPVLDAPAAAGRWSRVVVDREGRIYLLDAAKPQLDIYDPQGEFVAQAQDAGDVRDRFDAPPLRLDHKGRFCLPGSLARPCDRQPPVPPPTPEMPLALCLPVASSGGRIFDREGNPARVEEAEPAGPRLYTTIGTWTSQALDSQIYRCQWHRIELALPDLPAGTQVTVSTYTDSQPRKPEEIQALPDAMWVTRHTMTGQVQPPPDVSPGPDMSSEFLVQSREGQYLWLRLQLASDGYGTPAVQSIRVYYPRESYLSYLPAVYAADDESRWFLERFLSIFQTEWDALEQQITDIARLFDPRAVPGGPFLAYLARWLALPLEATWSADQQRRMLEAAPVFYPRRGTVDGLQAYLRIYLQNMTGLAPAQQGLPAIVEGFRERTHLLLSVQHVAELGRQVPLWSHSVVGRLQLGVNAREGEVQLVSTGDPEHDVFDEYAHRFRVFIPASWVRTLTDERMVRRAIDAEKPAHTSYDMQLVEARFRVGIQSTIGLDTIIGTIPMARLACVHDADEPPSRPPRHRLGYDTILSAGPTVEPSLHLAPGTRVGIETALT
jgi:phage tail-like protein